MLRKWSFRTMLNLLICGLVLGAGAVILIKQVETSNIDSFDDCVAAGRPIMESYPEQCAANGQTFTNPRQQLPAEL